MALEWTDGDALNEQAMEMALRYAQMPPAQRRPCFERLEQESPELAKRVTLHLAPMVVWEQQMRDTAWKDAKRQYIRDIQSWIKLILMAILAGTVGWWLFLR